MTDPASSTGHAGKESITDTIGKGGIRDRLASWYQRYKSRGRKDVNEIMKDASTSTNQLQKENPGKHFTE